MVSCGTTTAVELTSGKRKQQKEYKTPANLNKSVLQTVSRFGVQLESLCRKLDGLADYDPAAVFTCSGYEMGGKEKVGERDCQIVKYKVTQKGTQPMEIAAQVWIDSETNLPLKHTFGISVKRGKQEISYSYVATCSDLKKDEKIDDSVFKAPKAD